MSGGECYYVSKEKAAWIEARKECQRRGAELVSLQNENGYSDVINMIGRESFKRFHEFWTSGNDIEQEGVWEWVGGRGAVPYFGWLEEPSVSAVENCLLWLVELDREGRQRNSWTGSSCCNNFRYICQL